MEPRNYSKKQKKVGKRNSSINLKSFFIIIKEDDLLLSAKQGRNTMIINKFIKKLRTTLLFLLMGIFLTQCEKLDEFGQKRMKERLGGPKVDEREIEIWKEKLGLEEAEIRELDEKIKQMIVKTKKAGALHWKIAKSYLKAGSYEISSEYYQKAVDDQTKNVTDPSNSRPEIHKFESAIPFFEGALRNREIDEELLFETGLAYGNASRDRGWDKERRAIAVNIFRGLMRRNPEDLRYPYELALIYFDSSINDGLVEGVSEGYNDTTKALKLMQYILEKQESSQMIAESVSTRFALGNFNYRIGKIAEAEDHYKRIKQILERFSEEGKIKNISKNSSYINVMRNLENIENGKLQGSE